jgi:hypothetical protein
MTPDRSRSKVFGRTIASRVAIVACAAVLGGVSVFVSAQPVAQNYPNKPIRMVVPFAAGGPVDLVGRLLIQKLNQDGQGTACIGEGAAWKVELRRNPVSGITISSAGSACGCRRELPRSLFPASSPRRHGRLASLTSSSDSTNWGSNRSDRGRRLLPSSSSRTSLPCANSRVRLDSQQNNRMGSRTMACRDARRRYNQPDR